MVNEMKIIVFNIIENVHIVDIVVLKLWTHIDM